MIKREKRYSFARMVWTRPDLVSNFIELADLVQYVDTNGYEDLLVKCDLYSNVGNLIKTFNDYEDILSYFDRMDN